MNFKQLTDSIYLIPVLLDHFKKPTKLTASILKEAGIAETEVQELRKMDKLLKYHLQTVRTWEPDYPLLREGLNQYFKRYLSKMFQVTDIVDKTWRVLDYGCGAGQIGKQFEKDNPNSYVKYLDRVNCMGLAIGDRFIEIDFEKTPNWYKGYGEKYDCVIMSELLHCKNDKVRRYLIASSKEILKPLGKLVIIENADYCMAYRMNKLKNETKLNVVTNKDLMELTMGKFRPLIRRNIVNHQINVYEKI